MEEENKNEAGAGNGRLNVLRRFMSADLDAASFRVLLFVIFLLPFFALPFGIFAVDFNKAMLWYIGISLASIFFLLARFNKRNTLFPRSFLLSSMFFVAFAWLIASLFSNNTALSLAGLGYETGTFAFFLFLAITAFLVSVLHRSVERITLLYGIIFVSALILFVVQFLHTGFGVPLPPWEMFSSRVSGLLGNWNDLGIFFGLIAILSLSCLEFMNGEKGVRTFLWTVLITSLSAVFFVNFLKLQLVLGIFVLALLVYRLVVPVHMVEGAEVKKYAFLRPSFFVFIAIVIFGLLNNAIGGLVAPLGIQFSQVYPSWGATLGVIKSVLSHDLFFGSGPNTFSYDWFIFRPDVVSNTIFWNTPFQSGVGRLPSMVAEAGVLGGVALITFIFSLAYKAKTVVSYKEQNLKRMLLASSFFGSVYLWVFVIIYVPGFLISALAGIFTGVLISSVNLANGVALGEMQFEKGTKKSYVFYSIIVILIGGFVCSIYLAGTRYVAGYFYSAALKEASVKNNLDKADVYLKRATMLAPQDVYFRSATEISLAKLRQLFARLNETNNPTDTEKAQFNNVLKETVQNAQNATRANPLDAENWMELGKVYETIILFDTEKLKASAISAYMEALRVSPHNPTPLLALARVELQTGNQGKALEYLNESIKIKSDFTAGHIMRAQVSATKGKLSEAISELEQTVLANPNNPENGNIILYIGILYYQDGYYERAQNIFEKLVSANSNFLDARYALGLVYDKRGRIEDAIAQFEAINTLVPENNEVQTVLNNLRTGRGALGNIVAPEPEPEVSTKKSVNKK